MPFLLPISHQGDHTPAAESMIAVLLLAAAFQPPSPATLVGSDRRAVRMCSAEDAARERWLKNSGRGQRHRQRPPAAAAIGHMRKHEELEHLTAQPPRRHTHMSLMTKYSECYCTCSCARLGVVL